MKTQILASVFLCAVNVALAASEFVPLAERAQGQSLTGASLMNDSIFSNPASSTFSNVYSVDGTIAMPKTFAVSILDTQTAGVGGGLGYFRKSVDHSDAALQGVRLAMASRISQIIGVGVTGKVVWGPDRSNADANYKDVDVGAMANLGYIKAGVTATNALGGSSSLEQARELIAGARIGYSDTLFASVASHAKMDSLNPYQYSVGAEYISPYYVALRAGYRLQHAAAQSWTGMGASFISPRLSVHYAVELPNQNQNSTEHLLGATMLF